MTQPSDPGRRGFFRTVAKDVVQTAGVALETVTSLNRAASEAAVTILRASSGEAAPAAGEPVAEIADPAAEPASAAEAAVIAGPAPAAPAVRPGPFRVDGGALFVVDEDRLPDAVVEIECRTPIDIAREIARRSLPGASVPGQAAAMSLALAASEMQGYLPTVRTAIMRIRAEGLVSARPSSQFLRVAVARVMAVYDALAGADTDGAAIAAKMRNEAETICREADAAMGLIGDALAGLLAETETVPVVVLTDATGVPFLAAGSSPRDLLVQVTDGGADRRGARVGSSLLVQAGIDHAVIPDIASGWLLGTGRIDAVVLGAERIAANGDTINDIGTYPLAVLAARHGVPVHVCGGVAALDPGATDGLAALVPHHDGRESGDGTEARATPRDEVTPHDLIASIVTERGVLRPPFTTALLQAR